MILHPTYTNRLNGRIRIIPDTLCREIEGSTSNTTKFIWGQGFAADKSFNIELLTLRIDYIAKCITTNTWARVTNENTTSV